jgi:hypothetical protein
MKTAIIACLMMLSGIVGAQQQQPIYAAKWVYSQEEDPMGGGTRFQAEIPSLNTVDLGFPYQGTQQGILVLRRTPREGNRVIIGVQRGQVAPGRDYVTVRFDDDSIRRFSIMRADDGTEKCVAISDYDGFVRRLARSSRVRIEVMFFDHGLEMFDFDVRGLNQTAKAQQ